jgi:amino acid adenylation domain-containing protein
MPISDIFDYPTVAQLAAQIANSVDTKVLPPIEVVKSRPDRIPLSFSQERLWFIDRLEGTIQYHVNTVLRLKGKLDQDAIEYALKTIVNRHEVLRTVILETDGEPYQFVKPDNRWQLNVIEGSTYPEDSTLLQEDIKTLIRKPFDLSKDDMMRATLVRINNDDHILVITIHHIASDGWSKSVLVNEVAALYDSYRNNNPHGLKQIGVQYADYAIWQRQYLEGEVLNQKIEYWKDKLQGVVPLQLPTDFIRPAVQSTRGAKVNFDISKEISLALDQLSKKNGCTVFMTLLAAFKVLLHRYSGQEDICVGTPIANRLQQELEGLIGFFVNTLALRTEVNGEASFNDLLHQVKTTTMEAYQNQEAPFEKVVESVAKGRDMSRNPLFQVMFVLRNTPEIPDLRLGELEFEGVAFGHETSLFDLTFFITETGSGLVCSLEYSTDLYSKQTISRFITHFKVLLSSIIKAPEQAIADLPMLTLEERSQVLLDFNNTETTYRADKSIMDLFEEQVSLNPDKTAVVFEHARLTYYELNERANQLANYLQTKGIKEESLVPVCVSRSLEMIIGVVAILKTGAAYVPVDPEYPQERIIFMLRDTASTILLSNKESRSTITPEHQCEIIEIDGDWPLIDKQSKNNPRRTFQPHHLAYVIYTSGSTGRPKGVEMPGGALVNLLFWQQKQFENKNRRVLQFASLNFDVSFQEIFSTLCFGSELYLISAERRKDVPRMLQDISKFQITHLFMPYIVLKTLAEYLLQFPDHAISVQEVIVAGEQLKMTDDIQSVINANNIRIINQYGPTEAHVVSSYTVDIRSNSSLLPPIGKPIDNTRLYIVDKRNQLVPVGVPGELLIGGVQVARGYLNQPELTAEKFVHDFVGMREPRLYRTGDLARWLPDGNIEYLGRIDEQVKIRGFRIELGEIETVLQASEMVRQAVVLAVEDGSGNKRLVSYIVPEGQFDREKLVAYVKTKLPEFMIPALWIEMGELPVTRNGKIDKRALPDPGTGQLVSNEYVAPCSDTEHALVGMWQELLGVERVGVLDNFFELGGHSLMVIKMVSNIKKKFLLSIPISALFQFTTIKELSNYLEWELSKEQDKTSERNKAQEEDESSFEVINL